MKKNVLAIVLFCVSTLCAFAQSVDSNLIDAVTLYGNGQYQKARAILQTLSKAAPDNDAVWYYLAQAEYRTGNKDAAQEAIQKAVQLDSSNYWYRSLLGRMQLMAGKVDESMREYESLVKDFPDKSSPIYDLLSIYLSQQKYEKALAMLDEIEKQRGPSEEVTRTRYDIYTSMGKQDEGAAILEKFNQQYSSPSILSMLGDYYLSDFADSLAQARYQEALELDSSYIPAILGMSEVHRHQRRYADYFQTLEPFFSSEEVPASSKTLYITNLTRSIDPKILQLHREGFDNLVLTTTEVHPADSSVLATAGSYFYTTGREEKAGDWFKAAADKFPESIGQTATYVQYLSLQKQWGPLRERAMEAYERFGEAAFLDYANMASYQLKDYDSIIANSRHILETHPKDKDLCLGAWSLIGDAYHEKGDSKQAYKAYEKALKIDPSYAPVLNNYAYYLSLEGKNLKKAYTMSKKTVEAEPDNATYLDTFAWILHLMGKDLEAKPFFKHAMLYGGKESAVILRHYATVLEALGENDTAKVYRNQAARLDAQEKK
ncbi:MAG: tetratricopeptide repeat protein [Bacteroidales bacterium]|nr:tetratricopeptide repeat protein [Bacteroidales bacterium]